MLAKNLCSTAEVTFWDTVITFLSGLRWLITHKRNVLIFLYQSVSWVSIGFLIGLLTGYVTF